MCPLPTLRGPYRDSISGVITYQASVREHVRFSTLTCEPAPCCPPKTIAHSDHKTNATACKARTGETCQVECDAGYLTSNGWAGMTICMPAQPPRVRCIALQSSYVQQTYTAAKHDNFRRRREFSRQERHVRMRRRVHY